MEARIDLYGSELGQQFYRKFAAATRPVTDSALPHTIQELCKLRASQINGCGFCTDMHAKDALAAGETQVRLNLVAAWRDAKVFTEAERAALALTEEGTRIADAHTGVSDEVWDDARKHFDDEQLVALVLLIGIINTYNRLSVITNLPAGDYEPGMFD